MVESEALMSQLIQQPVVEIDFSLAADYVNSWHGANWEHVVTRVRPTTNLHPNTQQALQQTKDLTAVCDVTTCLSSSLIHPKESERASLTGPSTKLGSSV